MSIVIFILSIFAIIKISGAIISSNERKEKQEYDNRRNLEMNNNIRNHTYITQGPFNDGWSLVELASQRYAFVNKDGVFLKSAGGDICIFDYAEDFFSGYAIVSKNKISALITPSGWYSIPFKRNDYAGDYYESTLSHIGDNCYIYHITWYKKEHIVTKDWREIVSSSGKNYILVSSNQQKAKEA